jgi:hypothetical protein
MSTFRSTTTILSSTLFLVAGIVSALGRPYTATPALAETPIDSGPPAMCPVTRPPNPPFVPPSPYSATTSPGAFWFGTQKLWTVLPTRGEWRGLKGYNPTDLSYRQKLFWWRQGSYWLAEPRPKLTVTGRQLDASEPPLIASGPGNGYRDQNTKSFMVVAVDFPTLGCWEITGDYDGDKLSYVVWVAQ